MGIQCPSFYYGHAPSHYTRGFIATSSYWTTLKCEQCIIFFGELLTCHHGFKTFGGMRR